MTKVCVLRTGPSRPAHFRIEALEKLALQLTQTEFPPNNDVDSFMMQQAENTKGQSLPRVDDPFTFSSVDMWSFFYCERDPVKSNVSHLVTRKIGRFTGERVFK